MNLLYVDCTGFVCSYIHQQQKKQHTELLLMLEFP